MRGRWLFLLGLGAGACAPEPTTTEASAPIAPPLAAHERMPQPARARLFPAVEQNRACESCHRDLAAEWRGSLHQRADIEPAYQRSFAIEPLPFCRGCHAPEADPLEPEPEALAELGVGCVTCHVTSDAGVLAAPHSATRSRPAPHGVVRSARFAKADACAHCHQFQFPGAHGDAASTYMQTTLFEHEASPAKDRSCADCHMPINAQGKRSHTFLTSRDPEFLRRAITLKAERATPNVVRVVLTQVDPGHAFPTGDLFRRLEVSAEISGPDQMSLGSATRYLTRHWGFRPTKFGRELLSDDRVMFEPREVLLTLPPLAAEHSVVWRVAYQRVAHPKGLDESAAELEAEVVLGSGVLEPAGGRP